MTTRDNAVIESWHSTLEFELRRLGHFATRAAARAGIAAWIEDYNHHRRHSALGRISPVDYERSLAGKDAAGPLRGPGETRRRRLRRRSFPGVPPRLRGRSSGSRGIPDLERWPICRLTIFCEEAEISSTLPSYLMDRQKLEEVSTEQARAVSMGNETILCRVLGRYKTLVDANDLAIVPHLCLDGYWESWITVALARVLRPGFWCLDVGANHGYYTLLMADAVGSGGRVLAVEPNPNLVRLLGFSLEINGLTGHASAIAYAASDIDGVSVNLVFPRQHEVYATICRSLGEGDESIEVDTVTLDTVSRDWPHVDLIKIDAEGAEQKIWRGMQQTMRRNPDVIVVMEVNRTRISDPAGFLRDIQDAGFALRHIAFDAEVRTLTEKTLLASENDWMLFLQRS